MQNKELVKNWTFYTNTTDIFVDVPTWERWELGVQKLPEQRERRKWKKQRLTWRKRVNFDPGMPSKSNPVLNVADEFPDICSMSPFELWQYMFGSNITHLALYESKPLC